MAEVIAFGVFMFCRRGDHHLCPVEIKEGRCQCACHERERQERKKRTG